MVQDGLMNTYNGLGILDEEVGQYSQALEHRTEAVSPCSELGPHGRPADTPQ